MPKQKFQRLTGYWLDEPKFDYDLASDCAAVICTCSNRYQVSGEEIANGYRCLNCGKTAELMQNYGLPPVAVFDPVEQEAIDAMSGELLTRDACEEGSDFLTEPNTGIESFAGEQGCDDDYTEVYHEALTKYIHMVWSMYGDHSIHERNRDEEEFTQEEWDVLSTCRDMLIATEKEKRDG